VKKALPGTLFLLIFTAVHLLHGSDDDRIYLKRIVIAGNRVTKEWYVRDLLTLRERQFYDLDTIIDEINRSRENLEHTGLFTNVFFNDELDELNNLILTVQLREKNYFQFGPSGYLGYEKSEFYSVLSLYGKHTNLFGNSSFLRLEVPVYRDYGVIARMGNGTSASLRYIFGFDARYDYFFDEYVQKFVAGLGYGFGDSVLVGTDIHVSRESPSNSEESTISTVFFPYFQWGYDRRVNPKQKNWYSLHVKPYLGVNTRAETVENRKTFSGIDGKLSLNWDVVLQSVYSLNLYASYQDGGVPHEYTLQSNIRGTYFDAYRGSYLISVTNDFDFPWPWNNRFHLIPFLDYGMIGNEKADFLIGVGLGLHWYTRYQNPFVFELAYGKGLMLNLTKRF
jgi:outer membrane protein assembly factor BamA